MLEKQLAVCCKTLTLLTLCIYVLSACSVPIGSPGTDQPKELSRGDFVQIFPTVCNIGSNRNCGVNISKVASSSDGHVFVVTLQDWHIYASRFDPSNGWQDAEQLDEIGQANFPEVVASANGNALVAWMETTSDGKVVYRFRYYRQDTGWGAIFTGFIPEGSVFQRYMNLAIDGQDSYVFFWNSIDAGDKESNWLQYYSPQSGLYGESQVNLGSDDASNPHMALNVAGDGLLTWIQCNAARTHCYMVGARLGALSGWRDAQTLSPADAGAPHNYWLPEQNHQLLVTANGNGLFYWVQENNTSTSSVPVGYLYYFNQIAGWNNFSTQSPPDRTYYVSDASNRIMKVWTEGGYGKTVSYYQVSQPNTGWSQISQLVGPSNTAWIDEISMNASGKAVALWLEVDHITLKVTSHFCRYTPNGGWSAPDEIKVGDIKISTDYSLVLNDKDRIVFTTASFASVKNF